MSQDAASTSLARLRAEIEATRRSLAETADALAARAAEPGPVLAAEPVLTPEPLPTPEPVVAAEPLPTAEPVVAAEPVIEPVAEPEVLPAAAPVPVRTAVVPAPVNLPVVYRAPARRRSVAVAGAVFAVAAMLVRRRFGR